MVFVAAELARKRQARGVKLNYPEAVAMISAEILEAARDGKSVSELMSWGTTLLSNSYPCAFISWTYDSYLSNSSVKNAMDALRNKAENRSTKACH